MTDMTAPASSRVLDVTSDRARARIRARYRKEARFRAYGLIAIGFAALFLVVLLTDILSKGIPAFFVTQATVPVTIEAADVDPNGNRNVSEIAKGDFAAALRKSLVVMFPYANDRASRRQLMGLFSSVAANELRDAVIADPNLIGKQVTLPLLLSDDADLFFKGGITEVQVQAAKGVATPSGTEGNVEIVSSGPDFAVELGDVKRQISAQLRSVRRDAQANNLLKARYQAQVQDLTAQLAQARAAGDKDAAPALEQALAKATSDLESVAANGTRLEERMLQLKTKASQPAAAEALDPTLPSLLVRINGGIVKATEVAGDRIKGTVIAPLSSAAPAAAGSWSTENILTPESSRRLGDREVVWLEDLAAKDMITNAFNWSFFTTGDSREPELAGVLGGIVGSALTLLVTLGICLPVGVAAAIYLEEFAPKNRFTELIEVNINNLAAVPSIVFGLLGLAIFLNFFGMPRSSALVGGLVLALLVLPTIIIAARAALKAVPPSIREAALGVGASHQQAVFHHVLPLAMPGIMTGTIIGMAHALGETAPLLLIGMVAFIVDIPHGIEDAATVLPVQIFLWSDLPEVAFRAKTSAAIIVLLLFLFVMNGAAIMLRKHFERRW
jgi:phosphate transport system permease protein